MRSPARRRPIPRNVSYYNSGRWVGYGKQVRDAESGWLFPERLTVEQRGGRVSARYADGSLDRPDWY